MKKNKSGFIPPVAGFTLVEILIATALFGLVIAGTISVYIMCNKLWHATSLGMQTSRESSLALSRLVYGVGTNSGLRAASGVTLVKSNDGSWHLTVSNLSGGVKYIDYSRSQGRISFPDNNSIICRDVSTSSVTTNLSGTIAIQLTVAKQDGMFKASNTVSTLVKIRNAQ